VRETVGASSFELQFGGRKLMRVETDAVHGDSAMRWLVRPRCVLLMRSHASEQALAAAPGVARFLLDELALRVLSDFDTVADCHAAAVRARSDVALRVLDARNRAEVDLVVCLGGDGLLLHICASVFGEQVPPIVAFNLGSLGFMNPFEFPQLRPVLRRVVSTDVLHSATVRSRLSLSIARRNGSDDSVTAERHQVLNDIVLERGVDPGLSNLEVFCDDVLLTQVQADGVVVASPTGSTAYSLSASGSMCHPAVRAMLLTPICPHSLSFRPVVLPEACCLTIRAAAHARRGAALRVDGRSVGKLARHDSLLVRSSADPVVCFARRSASADWYASVRKCLHWNETAAELPGDIDTLLDDSFRYARVRASD